ncbi:glucose-6-phosphate dehydrogenase (NADP(+)) [Candidatus Peribacteria bacterium]|jgi:glucose-6-phosphate 1-dehydrogenase|nr:glucose-6-phosphate dehydrogenase (NADP(+)) [Candidatus Peribacteria bacterium]MBT4020843.1 glucose-6-phosphate dehydrogenase (NADP(+)) [Candidatus Peribacteria bacterium]MBT4241132.1 glucose-6-phosphate dehydrogenase (NADP(+)) [Candidatus Peribacteria bacterium]MBT4473854.1 glucose-6-phosphate dehydrogenase (NADP(+)) [Candidatus Peribacteria bacterium]
MLKAKNDFSLIIFGASGHLARIKIFPALYYMALKKRFPKKFAIIGYARSEMDNEGFKSKFSDAVLEHVPAVNEEVLSELLEHVHYERGQYDSEEDFKKLNTRLSEIEKDFESKSVRIAYLSVPPTSFGAVAKNLCASNIHDHNDGKDFRCIVEKPLGHNYSSAQEIRENLTKCFEPHEIYLLDHYLGKEAARNIYYLRLVNPIIERVLKHTMVTNVQITASEAAGLEGRAGYFEAVGTFRDMFQSHLLQLMALLTMQLVERDKLPQAREEALKSIYVPPAADLSEVVLQGQYASSEGHCGYKDEEGVASDSRTSTYATFKLMTRMSRWQGTPFYLRSGKRLHAKETKIALEFRNPYASQEAEPNRMEIILQGEAGVRIYLHTKKGGTEPDFRPLTLGDPLVCVGDCMDEHGLLLLECINGKQDWFLDFEESTLSWKLIDPIQAYLDADGTPLYEYPCGENGPKEVSEWIGREGYEWI